MNMAILEALCGLDGISGRETAVREYIQGILPKEACFRTDPLGNLIVEKPGARRPGHTVMLCAHMDEVGLILTHITEDGFCGFAHVGGIDRRAYIGRPVRVGKRAVPGVVGLKPTHLCAGDEKKAIPRLESLYIDIGADSREEARAMVAPGDSVVFSSAFVRFGEAHIKARAIDDRVGCAILLELLHQALPYDILAVFSAREEIGGAARAAAFALAPDYAIVIETTTAADLPGVSGAEQVCRLGGGAVVPFMDKASLYPYELYERAMVLAREHGIPAQTKTLIAGGNDAGSIQHSREGIPALAVSVPCRGLHSPCVTMKESDAEAVLALTGLLWEELSK
ncbi:MAG: M42 family peptidase [Oscillospiraceae bacterium]|nr:M42 family peptidase [Oscillospiraceae bacterium]